MHRAAVFETCCSSFTLPQTQAGEQISNVVAQEKQSATGNRKKGCSALCMDMLLCGCQHQLTLKCDTTGSVRVRHILWGEDDNNGSPVNPSYTLLLFISNTHFLSAYKSVQVLRANLQQVQPQHASKEQSQHPTSTGCCQRWNVVSLFSSFFHLQISKSAQEIWGRTQICYFP